MKKPKSLEKIGGLNHISMGERSCGIYFLCLRGHVVYVGQSTNVMRRVAQHIDEGEKVFDDVFVRYCQLDELDSLESAFIHSLEPDYNLTLPNGTKLAPMTLDNMKSAGFLMYPKKVLTEEKESAEVEEAKQPLNATQERLIRLPEVMSMTGFKKSTIYDGMKKGTFPMPLKLSKRMICWPDSQIKGWIRDQINARR